MMSDLSKFFDMNFKDGVFFIAAALIITVFLIQKWDWVISRFGVTSKKTLEEEKHNEEIQELKNHVKNTDQKIDKIFNKMDILKDDLQQVSQQVNNLQNRIDENEVSKLGDRLIQLFKYYDQKKELNTMEKWAFDNLAKQYIKSGGDSYIEEVVLPASKSWIIIDLHMNEQKE